MSVTLVSLLCDEPYWRWDSSRANTITFHKDGTGELECCGETSIWIAAEFDWKPQSLKSLKQVIHISDIRATRRNTRLVTQFGIEITLTKRPTPRMRAPRLRDWKMNELLLTDDAFLSKMYTISLEKGNFLSPHDASIPFENEFTPRFALRLVFDKSPYPPRHEWKEPDGAPDMVKMWEWKEFCGGESAELKSKSLFTWGGNCVVC